MKKMGVTLISVMAFFVVISAIGCGDSSSPCSASVLEPSECGPKSANGVSWGAWARDYDGDGLVDEVNAWNDCGMGGTTPGSSGTIDCPPGTTSGTSNEHGIICQTPNGQAPISCEPD